MRTSGPLDSAVPQPVAEQALVVLREALSNVAQHAHAGEAVVELEVQDGELVLRVTDDGRGLPAERHESGLRNARRRAREHGGTMRLRAADGKGTVLEWTVPLAST
jgi:signal transduction histidine kinase